MTALLQALSCKSPFLSPLGKQEEADRAKREFNSSGSDHIAVLRAYEQFVSMNSDPASQRRWCIQSYLDMDVLQNMTSVRRQLRSQLQESGFVAVQTDSGAAAQDEDDLRLQLATSADDVQKSDDELLLPCVLCAAMFPNLAQVRNNHGGKSCTVHTKEGEAFFHPCSVNFRRSDLSGGQWFAYLEKVATSKVYIRDATRVTPLAMMLFSAGFGQARQRQVVTLDGWIEFVCRPNVLALIEALRSEIEKLLLAKAENPHTDIGPRALLVRETVVQLVSEECP